MRCDCSRFDGFYVGENTFFLQASCWMNPDRAINASSPFMYWGTLNHDASNCFSGQEMPRWMPKMSHKTIYTIFAGKISYLLKYDNLNTPKNCWCFSEFFALNTRLRWEGNTAITLVERVFLSFSKALFDSVALYSSSGGPQQSSQSVSQTLLG